MKYDKLNRRYFLQGLGGSLLSLPILPSLLSKAHAQTLPKLQYLVMFGSPHGGYRREGDLAPQTILNPNNNALLTNATLLNGHAIRHASLNTLLSTQPNHPGGNVDNNQARLSYILGSFMNPLLPKMNLFEGIDLGTFYSGHNNGVYAGNLAKVAIASAPSRTALANRQWPTIDQFLGNSSKFYPNPEDNSVRTINNSNFLMTNAANGSFLPRTGDRIDRIYNAVFSKFENQSNNA